MSENTTTQQPYMVSIHESNDVLNGLLFTFVPKRLQQLTPGELPRRPPQYIVLVRGSGDNIAFDWSRTPDEPGEAKPEIEREAAQQRQRPCRVDRVNFRSSGASGALGDGTRLGHPTD